MTFTQISQARLTEAGLPIVSNRRARVLTTALAACKSWHGRVPLIFDFLAGSALRESRPEGETEFF